MTTTHASSDSFATLAAAQKHAKRPPFDYEALYKLPKSTRYFNVSVLWIAYYPHLVRLLYTVRVRHEVVTLLSLACGLSAAIVVGFHRTTAAFIIAAFLIHLKDAFDASDGSLARLTNTGHRIGRFLDTIGDGIVFTALIAAVARSMIGADEAVLTTLMWAGATWLSLFLQCSYFNFYHLHYTRISGVASASRLDESRIPEDETAYEDRSSQRLYSFLHALYVMWFRWQDSLIQRLDRWSCAAARLDVGGNAVQSARWYGTRTFLVANSALCYGTHAFVLILCLLAGRPYWFFPGVAVVMNLYFAAIIVSRVVRLREVS